MIEYEDGRKTKLSENEAERRAIAKQLLSSSMVGSSDKHEKLSQGKKVCIIRFFVFQIHLLFLLLFVHLVLYILLVTQSYHIFLFSSICQSRSSCLFCLSCLSFPSFQSSLYSFHII